MRARRQEPHAIARARERLGLQLHTGDLRALEADCAAGRTVLMSRAPDGVTKHAVTIGDVAVVAVIGADGRCVTILPRAAQRPAGDGKASP